MNNPVEKYIHHLTHPKHPLKQVYRNAKFECKACKSEGKGMRFRCDQCNFNIHETCGTCPDSLFFFIHPQHELQLKQRSLLHSYKCDLCKKSIKGMVYKCKDCNFFVHPICSQLPELLVNHDMHPPHPLKLELKSSKKCDVCEKSCKQWRYTCWVCDVHIHVGCLSGKPTTDPDEGGFGEFLAEVAVQVITELVLTD